VVAEYSALRGEIQQRINNQLLLLGFSAALVGALIPLVVQMSRPDQVQFLLIMPSLFLLIACMYYEQHVMVVHLSSYIWNALRPQIDAHPNGSGQFEPFGWETHRRVQTSKIWRYGAHIVRILATVGVAVVCLAIGLGLRAGMRPATPLHWYLVVALVFQFVLFVAFIHLLLQLIRADRGIRSGKVGA
jgi:hypothetical protein